MPSRIYRNGVPYGGGGAASDSSVQAVRCGDDIYTPVEGTVNLPDFTTINDTTASDSSVYSSNKTNVLLGAKADKTETKEYPIAGSVSGDAVSVTDSADSTVQELTVYGRSHASKNLIRINATSQEINGVKWEVNNDGTIDVSGTPTNNSYIVVTANISAINKTTVVLSGLLTTTNLVWDYIELTDGVTSLGSISVSANNNAAINLADFPTAAIIQMVIKRAANNVAVTGSIKLQLEYGSEPTPYEPYGIISIGDSGELDVQTCGKNLWNGKYISSTFTESDTWSSTYKYAGNIAMPIHPGIRYVLSVNGSAVQLRYAFLNSNKERIEPLDSAYNTTIAPENAVYLQWRTLEAITTSDKIQLELGTTATSYEPYISSTATLTTGLPYCGIPVTSGETYTDEQGQKWLADTAGVEGVTKRVYKVTFDGSEDEEWVQGSPNYRFYIKKDDAALGSNLIALGYISTTEQTKNTIRVTLVGTHNCIDIRDDGTITTLSDWKAHLASNPLAVVYELAEPYEISLASAELSALRGLKTYNPTTNVTITDDPFVDMSYIKNTTNGKAAEQLADNLRASIGWTSAVPEMHRNIFRGQSLGSTVTAAQLAAIADGSFDDLYVGDYWTTEFTYGGNTFTVNWRIADIDYYIDRGNPALTAHHLLIMPDCMLANAQLNSYATVTYYNSDMYATVIPALLTAIQSQFTDKILTFYDVYGTSTSDMQNRARQLEIPTSFMCLGSTLMSDPENAISIRTNFFDRLALFNLCPKFVAYKAYTGATGNVNGYWTRTNGTIAQGWAVIGTRAGTGAATDTYGVRPYFLLGDVSNI